MSDAPNTSPAFIQTSGFLGVPIKLNNQVCSPDNPGTTPVIAYSADGGYAQGNGALIEEISVQLTGTTVATTVVMFLKDLTQSSPEWLKISQVAIAAHTYASTTVLPAYKMPLKDLLFPVPAAGAGTADPPQQFKGLRLRSNAIQIGFALTVVISAPIIISLWGGEY